MGQNLKNMKTILYIGATLMIGASIYGFVDYKKTSLNKEFTKMYDSKKVTAPVVTTDKIKKVVIKPETKTTEKMSVIKKQPVKKVEVIEEKTVTKMPMKPMETINAEKAANDPTLKENSAVTTDKPAKIQKRVSTKLFSRAALDEKYISKELKIEPSKESPKKTVQVDPSGKNKEQ